MTGSPSVTTLPSSLNSTCNSWAGAVKVLRKYLWLYVGQPTLQGGASNLTEARWGLSRFANKHPVSQELAGWVRLSILEAKALCPGPPRNSLAYLRNPSNRIYSFPS